MGVFSLFGAAGCGGDTAIGGSADYWGGASSPVALSSTWRIYFTGLTQPGSSYQSSDPGVIAVSAVMTDHSAPNPAHYVELSALATGRATLTQIQLDSTFRHSAGFEVRSADKLGVYAFGGPPGTDVDRPELWVHTRAGLGLRYYAGGSPLWGQGAYSLANVTAFKLTSVPDLFLIESVQRPALGALDLVSGGAHLTVPIHIVVDEDVAQLALTPETPPSTESGTAQPPRVRIWGSGTTAAGQTVHGIPLDWTVDGAKFPSTVDGSVQVQGDVLRYNAGPKPTRPITASFNGHSVSGAFNGAAKDVTWQYASGCDISGVASARRAPCWPSLALFAVSMLSIRLRRSRVTAAKWETGSKPIAP